MYEGNKVSKFIVIKILSDVYKHSFNSLARTNSKLLFFPTILCDIGSLIILNSIKLNLFTTIYIVLVHYIKCITFVKQHMESIINILHCVFFSAKDRQLRVRHLTCFFLQLELIFIDLTDN